MKKERVCTLYKIVDGEEHSIKFQWFQPKRTASEHLATMVVLSELLHKMTVDYEMSMINFGKKQEQVKK